MNEQTEQAEPVVQTQEKQSWCRRGNAARRCRWRTVLLALLLFGTGFIAGGAVGVAGVVQRAQHNLQHPEEVPPRLTHFLTRKLKLTDAQQTQVQAILTQRQAALLALRQEVLPQVRAELDGAKADIDAVLDAQQRERWQELYAQMSAKWLPAGGSHAEAQAGGGGQ